MKTIEVQVDGLPPMTVSAASAPAAFALAWDSYCEAYPCSFREFMKIARRKVIQNPPGVGDPITVLGRKAWALEPRRHTTTFIYADADQYGRGVRIAHHSEISEGHASDTQRQEPAMSFPDRALSVRQPWAWAIIHAGKDIENRSWQAVNHGLAVRGRVAIHASATLGKAEYHNAADFMGGLGIACPPPAELDRGGIIGSVEVVDVVRESDSPWFFGPRGLVLASPEPCGFIPVKGCLGYFAWLDRLTDHTPDPAPWMLTAAGAASPAEAPADLFSSTN